MSLDVYKDMLNEEMERKHKALKAFEMDIRSNSRFPIYIKKVKGNNYIYINDGKNGKFHYKLLGSERSFSKDELDRLIANSKKYEEDVSGINEIYQDIDKLEKILRILG